MGTVQPLSWGSPPQVRLGSWATPQPSLPGTPAQPAFLNKLKSRSERRRWGESIEPGQLATVPHSTRETPPHCTTGRALRCLKRPGKDYFILPGFPLKLGQCLLSGTPGPLGWHALTTDQQILSLRRALFSPEAGMWGRYGEEVLFTGCRLSACISGR